MFERKIRGFKRGDRKYYRLPNTLANGVPESYVMCRRCGGYQITSMTWTPATGVGMPSRQHVLRQCARFTLVQGTRGFWWALTSREGFVWYWHSQVQLWIANRCSHSTIEEATAGLDELLTKEMNEDSDKQPEALNSSLDR